MSNCVFCFFSRLGDGERAIKDQPVEVKLPQELNFKGSDPHVDDVNIVGVACGSRHSFIWTETGQAYSFGNNFYAQLGYDFQRADFKEHQVWSGDGGSQIKTKYMINANYILKRFELGLTLQAWDMQTTQ